MDKPGSICPVGTVRMVPGCHARLSGEAELWTAAVYRANPGLGCGLVNDDAVYLASLIAAINSIVGGIGLTAADCQNRERGQRCPPGRYHRRRGSVRAAPVV